MRLPVHVVIALMTLAGGAPARATAPAEGPARSLSLEASSDGSGASRTVTRIRGPEWTASDWIGGFLFADLGVLVGGVVGGYGGAFLAKPDLDELDTAFRTGAALVAPLFVAGGVSVYASKRHRGAYGAALVGAYLGMGAALGLGLLAGGDHEDEVGLAASFILPALGATVGYYLSRETHTRTVPASGALLDVGRDGVVRLAVPNVLVRDGTGDLSVSITLLGGAL